MLLRSSSAVRRLRGATQRKSDNWTASLRSVSNSRKTRLKKGTLASKKSQTGKIAEDLTKYYFGTHETQVSEAGEAGLLDFFTKCTKNPGHCNMIPILDLTLENLPVKHRDPLVLKAIQAIAELTVRVAVSYTSLDRPQVYSGTDFRYPFCDMKGMEELRTGTGRVHRVIRCSERQSQTCPCKKCKESPTPSKSWGEVVILTATHTVFDDSEAAKTTCRLFYDKGDDPVVEIDGVGVWEVDIEKDRVRMKCVTCDSNLIADLDRKWNECNELLIAVCEKYKATRRDANMIALVSHPHGCPKYVSFGEWTRRDPVGYVYTKYTYTASTCPGSSGAFVYRFGSDGWYGHVHSGCKTGEANYSGSGYDDFR